jgi:hypothetical protein
MSTELCKTLALTLNDQELALCWRVLYEEHQRRSDKRAALNKGKLQAGDTVEWTSSGKSHTGVIDRVKRKKALVFEHTATSGQLSDRRWDIPLGMLKMIS